MINIRRFPGVIFRHKTRLGLIFLLVSCIYYLMHRWGFVCTNHEISREIDRLCSLYKKGDVVGTLCNPLCIEKEIHSISCISPHSKKQFVFTAKWKKRLMVMKSSIVNLKKLRNLETQFSEPQDFQNVFNSRRALSDASEKLQIKKKKKALSAVDSIEAHFENKIKKLVKDKLNLTLTQGQLEELKFLETKNKFVFPEDSDARKVERENVFSLLQSQEYLLSRLYADRDVFPQIIGTCGHFYGVEYLESPKFDSLFALDEKAEWSERMKLAVAIMDFVEEVETNFPDALYFCDLQMNHFGITTSGRVKFLDMDLVFMKNIVEKILKSGQNCLEHKDCDLFDCRSTCNLKKNICDSGVANDNLQGICEKIFIGWTMSGKMIVPGLLMSEYTPASLSALLRLCAENPREPVAEDLRQRLYTTLTEMHQILIQKMLLE